MNMRCRVVQAALLALGAFGAMSVFAAAGDPGLRPVPLHARVTHVQPMCGIVFWADSEHNVSDAIQLEFSYMKYGDVVRGRDTYDWASVDRLLEGIARRGHQAILRFYDTYPAQPTTVPAYIRQLPDYRETQGRSEGKATGFPDWSNAEWQRCFASFYAEFARRYDSDARLAFLEAGFGLWAEYHIYDGPMKLGHTFPDMTYQAGFLAHMARHFPHTPWLISVDAADSEISPVAGRPDLLALPFGVFDDSFLCRQHAKENEPNWNALDRSRHLRAPAGGEFSYYNKQEQKAALAPAGPHGIPFEQAAKAFHITYMIGSDQPDYQPMDRIRAAGLACGYRFRVVAFASAAGVSSVTVLNAGIAPIYQDAFPAVDGIRSAASLKGLAPGERREFRVPAGGPSPRLSIECDRLVPGQRIEFEAELP